MRRKKIDCQEIVSKYKVVSNLSCYVTDDEIRKRFIQIEVEIVSVIKRHYYIETNIAVGTRIIRVKLTSYMSLMPYSMKIYHTNTDLFLSCDTYPTPKSLLKMFFDGLLVQM